MLLKKPITALAIFIIISQPLAAAVPVQPLQEIRETAVNYARQLTSLTGDQIQITAAELDQRLRLPHCEVPLEGYSPYQQKPAGNATIGIRCRGVRPWSIFVPVYIQYYDRVAVAINNLPANKILTQEDIRVERTDVSSNTIPYLKDPQQIIGKQLTRPLLLGQPFSPYLLKPPIIVHRGDKVMLLSNTRTIEVNMQGEALANAAVGQTIQVRNLRSKRIVEGKLLENGVVDVD